MNEDYTSVTGRNRTHCIPASQKSAGVKEAYVFLNLSLFENTGRKVSKTCFAFLSFNDNSTLSQKRCMFSNL